MLVLRLSPLPTTLRGPAGDGYHGQVPRRALFLAPDAAWSLQQVETAVGGLVYTDIFRSAAAALAAHATKSGTQPPAFSAHGYGLAVDLDVGATLRRLQTSYPKLREALEKYGWYCHRADLNSTASEGWHFNYLGPDGEALLKKYRDATDHSTWAIPVEVAISRRYATQFKMTNEEIATALATLKFASVSDFQTAWGLDADGIPGPRTQRVLAYVTSQIHVEAPAPATPDPGK